MTRSGTNKTLHPRKRSSAGAALRTNGHTTAPTSAPSASSGQNLTQIVQAALKRRTQRIRHSRGVRLASVAVVLATFLALSPLTFTLDEQFQFQIGMRQVLTTGGDAGASDGGALAEGGEGEAADLAPEPEKPDLDEPDLAPEPEPEPDPAPDPEPDPYPEGLFGGTTPEVTLAATTTDGITVTLAADKASLPYAPDELTFTAQPHEEGAALTLVNNAIASDGGNPAQANRRTNIYDLRLFHEGQEVQPTGSVAVYFSGVPIMVHDVAAYHINEQSSAAEPLEVELATRDVVAAALDESDQADQTNQAGAGAQQSTQEQATSAVEALAEVLKAPRAKAPGRTSAQNTPDPLATANTIGNVVAVQTDHFSLYALTYTYTVDFHYDGTIFSIPGESDILLSDLFEQLGIEKNAADAGSVVFSDPTLLQVDALTDGDGNTADWRLTSRAPFQTDETLTIAFDDGEVLVINVTDAVTNGTWGNYVNYAWDDVSKTLTLTPTEHTGTGSQYDGYVGTLDTAPWVANDTIKSQVKDIVFSGKIMARGTFAQYFNGLPNLESVNMSSVQDCYNGTTKVTSMSQMFRNCPKLKTVSLPDSLTYTSVARTDYMFDGCTALETIDWGGFNSSNVTNMSYMFRNCSSLATLNLPAAFNTSKVTNMARMFYGCSSLKKLTANGWDISNVTNMNYMFNGCSSLEELNVEDWTINNDTAAVQLRTALTSLRPTLKTLNAKDWDLSGVTNLENMFTAFRALKEVDLSDWKMPDVTSMEKMFQNCILLEIIDTTGWDTSKVENMASMFYGCDSLYGTDGTFDISHLDLSAVRDASNMFAHCYEVKEIVFPEGSKSLRRPTNLRGMFDHCHKLGKVNVESFKVENVTDMSYMFYECYELKTIDLSTWTPQNVTDMNYMFKQCRAVEELDFSGFNTSKLVEGGASQMFDETSNLKKVVLGDGFTYSSSPDDGAFPRGMWLKDGSEKLASPEISKALASGTKPGTYIKQSDTSLYAIFPVAYIVDPEFPDSIPKVEFNGNTNFNLGKDTASSPADNAVIVTIDPNAVDGTSYSVPGSFTLTFPGQVKDAEGHKYDLVWEVSDIFIDYIDDDKDGHPEWALWELPIFYLNNNVPKLNTNYSYEYPGDDDHNGAARWAVSVNNKLTVVQSEATDPDSPSVDPNGAYIFSAFDLDVNGKMGPDNWDSRPNSPYTEGVTLESGYNPNNIITSDRFYEGTSILEVTKENGNDRVQKKVEAASGDTSDSSTERSEVLVEAYAGGFQFKWTGSGAYTEFFAFYEPKRAQFMKTGPSNQALPGAELVLEPLDTNKLEVDYTVHTVAPKNGGTWGSAVDTTLQTALGAENLTWTSTSSTTNFVLVPNRFYRISETSAPNGYSKIDDVIFFVDNDYNIQLWHAGEDEAFLESVDGNDDGEPDTDVVRVKLVDPPARALSVHKMVLGNTGQLNNQSFDFFVRLTRTGSTAGAGDAGDGEAGDGTAADGDGATATTRTPITGAQAARLTAVKVDANGSVVSKYSLAASDAAAIARGADGSSVELAAGSYLVGRAWTLSENVSHEDTEADGVVVPHVHSAECWVEPAADAQAETLALKGGETLTINDLIPGWAYEVFEADYASAGYVTTYVGAAGTIPEDGSADAYAFNAAYDIGFTKTDVNGSTLPGAQFELVAVDYTKNHTQAETSLGTFSTGDAGQFAFSLTENEYIRQLMASGRAIDLRLKETVAPSGGYVPQQWEITLTPKETLVLDETKDHTEVVDGETVSHTHTNDCYKLNVVGFLDPSKDHSAQDHVHKDACYIVPAGQYDITVKDASGRVVGTSEVTTSLGTLQGAGTGQDGSSSDSVTLQAFKLVNERLVIEKLDDGGQHLTGATLAIYEEGDVVPEYLPNSSIPYSYTYQWNAASVQAGGAITTQGEAITIEKALTPGKVYRLTETGAPAGYMKAQDIWFAIHPNGEALLLRWSGSPQRQAQGQAMSVSFSTDSIEALGALEKLYADKYGAPEDGTVLELWPVETGTERGELDPSSRTKKTSEPVATWVYGKPYVQVSLTPGQMYRVVNKADSEEEKVVDFVIRDYTWGREEGTNDFYSKVQQYYPNASWIIGDFTGISYGGKSAGTIAYVSMAQPALTLKMVDPTRPQVEVKKINAATPVVMSEASSDFEGSRIDDKKTPGIEGIKFTLYKEVAADYTGDDKKILVVLPPSSANDDTVDMSKVGSIVASADAAGAGATTVPVVLATNLEDKQFNGAVENTTSKTNEQGILNFGTLNYGTYWVVEVDTPVDYKKPYPMKIEVTEEGVKYYARSGGEPENAYKRTELGTGSGTDAGSDAGTGDTSDGEETDDQGPDAQEPTSTTSKTVNTVVFKNSSEEFELPKTGGIGEHAYLLAGAALIGFALLALRSRTAPALRSQTIRATRTTRTTNITRTHR